MSSKELVAAVLERASEADGRRKLTCKRAFEIARELGIEIGDVGRTCNEQGVRICQCQLGCFR